MGVTQYTMFSPQNSVSVPQGTFGHEHQFGAKLEQALLGFLTPGKRQNISSSIAIHALCRCLLMLSLFAPPSPRPAL